VVETEINARESGGLEAGCAGAPEWPARTGVSAVSLVRMRGWIRQSPAFAIITGMPPTGRPTDEPAHDILAAEAFAMPAPDPVLHHGPVRLPDDPTGIPEPHDVLAAEEFPMPAPRRGEGAGGLAVSRAPMLTVAGGAAVAGVALLVRRLRRR
jgi:hypothetical protein